MDCKTIAAEIKQVGEEGGFEAVIATLGAIDHDNDIVEVGALAGKVASIVPAHQQQSIPLGKVRIEERGDQVVAVGGLNLEIQAAREWHAALKYDLASPPAVQQWSWGYVPTKSREGTQDGKTVRFLEDVDLIEVSPVLRGASIGSRTLAVKRDLKLADHLTSVREEVEAVLERVESLWESRTRQGKSISRDAREEILRTVSAVLELSGQAADLDELAKRLDSLAKNAADTDSMAREIVNWQAHRARWGRRA